jgi:hypothetical protein
VRRNSQNVAREASRRYCYRSISDAPAALKANLALAVASPPCPPRVRARLIDPVVALSRATATFPWTGVLNTFVSPSTYCLASFATKTKSVCERES